jgi:hypothetical protein
MQIGTQPALLRGACSNVADLPFVAPSSDQPLARPATRDRIQLQHGEPAHAVSHAARPARRGWLAAGAFALIAVAPGMALAGQSGLAAAPHMATQARAVPAPPPAVQATDGSSSTPDASTQVVAAPMSDTQFAAMKQLAAPGKFDNDYAQRARARYADLTSNAWLEAQSFQQQASDLDEQGRSLELHYGASASGSYEANVSVTHDGGKTSISQTIGDKLVEDVVDGKTRSVHVKDSSGDKRLDVNSGFERLSTSDTVATYYMKSEHGFKAGDFIVQHHFGPREKTETVVNGLSILRKTHLQLSGIAGNIDIDRQESVTVPEASIQPYPQTLLDYSTSEKRSSELLNTTTSKSESIAVRADGSTHNETVFDGDKSVFDTPAAATAPTVAPE